MNITPNRHLTAPPASDTTSVDMIDDPTPHIQPPAPGRKQQGGHHGLLMIACCIPMLGLAIVLVATGVVGAGFIFAALACTAMMALMMRGMNHGGMNHGGMDHSAKRPTNPPSHTVPGRPKDR